MTLSRSEPEAVSAALAPLWVAFPPPAGASDGAAEARVLVYAKALDDIPAWAVGEAVMAFLRGEVDRQQGHMFAPTAPELRIEARRRMKRLEERRHETHMLLQAAPRAVVTAEEAERRRQRVAEIMSGVTLSGGAR